MNDTRGLILDPSCPIEWSHPLNRDLVADWTIPPNVGWRGGLTLRDLTGLSGKNPNHGTLTGGPTWTAGPTPGLGSLSFDGTNDVVSASAVGVGSGTSREVTVSYWAKPRTITNENNSGCVSIGSGSGNTCLVCQIAQVSGTYYIATDGVSWAMVISGAQIPPVGVWSHITITQRNDGFIYYFLNGVYSSFANPGNKSYVNNEILIGRRNDAATGFFDGLITDVRVKARRVTDSEVQAEYNQSRRGHPDRLRWLKPWSFGVTTSETATALAAAPISDTRGLILDPSCPIDWSHPLNRGLVAEYTGASNPGWSGGLTLRDLVGLSSLKAKHGTRVNSPTWAATGRGDIGLVYNRSNTYVTLPALTADTGTLTLAAWVNPSSITGTWQLALEVGTNRSTGTFGIGITDAANGNKWFSTGAAASKDCFGAAATLGWHRLVGVLSGGTAMSVYVDGVFQNSITASSTTVALTSGGRIGTNIIGTDPYGGVAAGVSIWSRALSAAEIAADYGQSRLGNPNRLRWLRPWSFGTPTAASTGNRRRRLLFTRSL